jgi:glycerophosphoryl diester phosphodiesterase
VNRESNHHIDIQGHRGCRGLLPENTIVGFIRALDLGVSTLELDIVISKDGQAIVSHEAYFNHEISTLPNGDTILAEMEKTYNIYNMSLSQIKAIDVGKKNHERFPFQEKIPCTKPTLEETFIACESYIKKNKLKLCNYNIELKFEDLSLNPNEVDFAKIVLGEIEKAGLLDRSNLQSFHHETLNAAFKINPKIRMAILVGDENKPEWHLKKLNFKPQIYSPYFSLVSKELIAEMAQENIKIIPWTVNELTTAQSLLDLGVDGIITDYPNIINHNTVKKNDQK